MFARTTSLRELTLGEGWQTVGNPALPNVPTNATYTGRWQNVASGTVAAPAGTHSLTSTVLMNTAGGRPPVADTWVWEQLVIGTSVATLAAQHARVPIPASSVEIEEWLIDVHQVVASSVFSQDGQADVVRNHEDDLTIIITDFAGGEVEVDFTNGGQYLITFILPESVSGDDELTMTVVLTLIPRR